MGPEPMNLARCPECTSSYCPIPSDGPRDAMIYAYGERPGQQEEFAMQADMKRGTMRETRTFIGPAGEEFNRNYLDRAGLKRSEVHVGNTVLCGSKNNKAPTEKEIEQCSRFHVKPELESGNPAIVVLMGSTACKMADRKIDLEAEHGIPFLGGIFGWFGWVVPMYHPALGLHKTSMMRDMMEDWERLGEWVRSGEWKWAVDDGKERDYRLARTAREVDQYFDDYQPSPADYFRHGPQIWWTGIDTEQHGKPDFSIQACIKPKTGLMVLEKDYEAIDQLAECLRDRVFIYHYKPADHPRMLRLGLNNEHRDTHIEAYNLALAQGLKALSKRLFGRDRKSWEETVGRASKDALCSWLYDALEKVVEWRTLVARVSEKTGKTLKPGVVKHEAEKTIAHILRYTIPDSEYEAWKKFKEFGGDGWRAKMEQALGREMPIKGIGNCKLDEAVWYGCSDADDTLCLALRLDQMRREFEERVKVTDGDKDELCLTIRNTR